MPLRPANPGKTRKRKCLREPQHPHSVGVHGGASVITGLLVVRLRLLILRRTVRGTVDILDLGHDVLNGAKTAVGLTDCKLGNPKTRPLLVAAHGDDVVEQMLTDWSQVVENLAADLRIHLQCALQQSDINLQNPAEMLAKFGAKEVVHSPVMRALRL